MQQQTARWQQMMMRCRLCWLLLLPRGQGLQQQQQVLAVALQAAAARHKQQQKQR
jgi:hypothetical protein